MNHELYPIKFIPSFHYRIWGGNGLKKYVGKKITEDCIGESWEISTVPNYVSEVANGFFKGKNLNEVMNHFSKRPELFLGTYVDKEFKGKFPLLIKFIDAETPLSVQVHPNDDFAKEVENSMGKTEMWYIMRAEEDSELIIGFKDGTTKEQVIKHTEEGTLEQVLNRVQPHAGDVYYIPAGRVHAIGKGITLAEIQQSSNITYRIYDYQRKDQNGNLRELHTDKAMQVANFEYIPEAARVFTKEPNQLNKVIDSQYFNTQYLSLNKPWNASFSSESFTIYICIKGEAQFHYQDQNYPMLFGESILIPAGITEHEIHPITPSIFLKVRI